METGTRENELKKLASALCTKPGGSARDLADSRQVLLVPLDKVSSVRTFYIVYNKNRILKSHVKQFIHFTEGFYQNPETP